MIQPRPRPLLVLVCLIAAWAFAGAALAAPEDFPRPASIEPSVAFWKRIYSEVDTGHGLLHDARNLAVVYEVVDQPDNLSRRGRDRWMKTKREHYKAILRRLANGKRTGLSSEEARVLALFPKGVSNTTLKAASGQIRFQLGQADRFREGVVRMGRWEDHVEGVLAKEGLPPELVALPHVESSYNPAARSHVGASGIWQFTRSTGRLFMQVDHVVDERNDPFLATEAAAQLLKRNHARVDSWPLALTGYNHGIAGMQRAARKLGTKDIGVIIEKYKSRTFGFASRNFYVSFLAASDVNENISAHLGPITKDPVENPEIVELDHYYRPAALAQAFGVPISALKEMNPALREPVWSNQKYIPKGYPLRIRRDPLRADGSVVLASVPTGQRFTQQVRDVQYKVRRGDTIGAIARRYGVKQSEIVALNGLRSRNRIRVGQLLELPSGSSKGKARSVSQVASAPRATTPRPADGIYRVRRGDSIDKIARQLGVSASALASANGIRDPHKIRVGQLLKLPGASAGSAGSSDTVDVYTVRRGDTLDAIAKRFGTTPNSIVAMNGIRNKHRIQPGQRLQVPTKD